MNITIVGTGYVGLVTGACLSNLGFNIICVDKDYDKISLLNNGETPIYEKDLETIIQKNRENGRLKFTTDIVSAIKNSKIIFIAVGTPTLDNGNVDLKFVFEVVDTIANNMVDYKLIVNKSTSPIGTCNKIKKRIHSILSLRKTHVNFDIASNPEFLREGSAVQDFMNPDRIVFGVESVLAEKLLRKLYKKQRSFKRNDLVITNNETAEMIKYASNTFLATKISFINEIANMCEIFNADVLTVSKAMGMDKRIGSQFLNPGPGYGGSCFPKDTKAFINIGKEAGYIPKIISAAFEVNCNQKNIIINKIKKNIINIKSKTITVLGLSFKPNTDDIRDSTVIHIIKELLNNEAKIRVFDPISMKNFKTLYSELDITYCTDIYDACKNSDCIILHTEWDQFKYLDFLKIKEIVNNPLFLDLRNIYDSMYVNNLGFKYVGYGRELDSFILPKNGIEEYLI